MLIDLLPLGLMALILWRVRPARPFASAFHEDALSPEAALPLRGALALMVVFHHLAQRTEAGFLMRLFTNIGFLPVAMFFFFSGYGVQKKHLASDAYRRVFLRRRLGAVLTPFLPALAVYVALHVALRPGDSPWNFFNGVIGEANAWFILNLLLFYLAYSLAMRLGPRPGAIIAVMSAWCVAYTGLCLLLGYGDWWYKSTPVLILGMIWATGEARITAFLRRRYWLKLALCWLACVWLTRNVWTLGWRLPLGAFLPSALAASLFAAGTALILMKLRPGNPVLNWLGGVSYDLYILHGILLICLHSPFCHIESDLLYALSVLAGSLGLAWASRRVRLWLRRRPGAEGK